MRKLTFIFLCAVLTSCVSTEKLNALARETRIASIKADVALLVSQRLDPVAFEKAVKMLGGELGAGRSRGETAAYFPLNQKDERPVTSLVVDYRIDETGHIIAVAIYDVALLE